MIKVVREITSIEQDSYELKAYCNKGGLFFQESVNYLIIFPSQMPSSYELSGINLNWRLWWWWNSLRSEGQMLFWSIWLCSRLVTSVIVGAPSQGLQWECVTFCVFLSHGWWSPLTVWCLFKPAICSYCLITESVASYKPGHEMEYPLLMMIAHLF